MIFVLAEPVCPPNSRLGSRLEPFAERCKLDGSELFILPWNSDLLALELHGFVAGKAKRRYNEQQEHEKHRRAEAES